MMTISRRFFDSEHADGRLRRRAPDLAENMRRAGFDGLAHRLPAGADRRKVKMQAAEALAQEKYGKGWTEL